VRTRSPRALSLDRCTCGHPPHHPRTAPSSVFRLADVVGWYVTAATAHLPQPPFAVAVHVLELQDADALVGRDGQLVGAARAEGIEGVVDLEERTHAHTHTTHEHKSPA